MSGSAKDGSHGDEPDGSGRGEGRGGDEGSTEALPAVRHERTVSFVVSYADRVS